jgi:tRNA G18 (ribose-2'-O)-methylase SpoU
VKRAPPVPVSAENQWFQLVATLKTNRQKRWREGLFFVEGVRSINQLRGNPAWPVHALLYAPERRLSGWARDVLAEIDAEVRLELTPELMDRLSDREEGSEIVAVVRMPRPRLSDLALGQASRVVLLDRPGNPGNLGSIIRSCDAFGVSAILIAGHSADPFDPLVVRASVGAFFSVPLVHVAGQAELEAWTGSLAKNLPDLRILGTSAKATRRISDCRLGTPIVLCFGNETMGLSQWLKSRCHELAAIPMHGVASSLNLACAVTAVLYEANRSMP